MEVLCGAVMIVTTLLLISLLKQIFALNLRLSGESPCYRLKFFLLYPLISFFLKRFRKKESYDQDVATHWEAVLPTQADYEREKPDKSSKDDSIQLTGTDSDGNFIFIHIRRFKHEKKWFTESTVQLCYGARVYTLPEHPRTIFPSDGDHQEFQFSANGATLELREAFRRWRVNFRGYLRDPTEPEKLVFVKIEGWWAHISDPVKETAFITPFAATNAILSSVQSKFRHRMFQMKRLLKMGSLHQWGQITGNLHIEGVTNGSEEIVLRGIKARRKTRRARSSSTLDWSRELKAYFRDGTFVYLSHIEYNNHSSSIPYGYIHFPRGEFCPIDKVSRNSFNPDGGYIKIDSGHECFILRIRPSDTTIVQENHLKARITETNRVTLEFNGKTSFGILTTTKPYFPKSNGKFIESSSRVSFPTEFTSRKHSVLPLTHIDCQNSALTGGKGSNLSKLFQIQTSFVIPKGVCITSFAYEHHVAENEELAEAIQSLADPENIRRIFIKSQLSRDLESTLEKELGRQFGEQWDSTDVAVRSSAVGEDSDQLSAAGQLDTYLGLKGIKNIAGAVVKCWASNFSQEVLSYRKQHGQELAPPAAVVVQQMISPDYAGVLFSQDPITGDSLKMIINANTGVGESVVSGLVTPDTIIVRRNYSSTTFEIVEKTPTDGRDEVCVSDEELVRLSQIGVELEKAFGQPQDIEWAIKDGEIYVLQSRPITSLEMESDWELLHEFDSGIIADDSWVTTANLGEVLPEAVSPLTCSITKEVLERILQAQMNIQINVKTMNKHRNRMFLCYRNRLLFSVNESMMKSLAHIPDSSVMEVSFWGHTLEDFPQIKEVSKRNFPPPTAFQSLHSLYLMIKVLFLKRHYLMKESITQFSNYSLPPCADPKENIRIIEDHVKDYCKATLNHTMTSAGTSFTYMSAEIIRGKRKELTPEIMNDIATLYASCQDSIISADIPNSLKRIAQQISKAGLEEEFNALSPEEAVEWLREAAPDAVTAEFESFIKLHGHRCPQEFDFYKVTWGDDPSQIIPSIKSLLGDKNSLFAEKKETSAEEALALIKTPLNRVAKAILRKFIPVARSSVAARETTKGLDVHVTNVFRQKYREIGEQLHKLNYLPEPELIYFLTHNEIKEMLRSRSPRIIARALRRRKLLPLQNQLVYPELIEGRPQPTKKGLSRNLKTLSELKGTAVCLGVVEGIARVAHDLDEARDTQPGEILITKSTDIGWSPFFPIISGLVTELGGLVSHGAVVAREYGLPCLIGVTEATDHFKTGDRVILDAEKGTITKVEV